MPRWLVNKPPTTAETTTGTETNTADTTTKGGAHSSLAQATSTEEAPTSNLESKAPPTSSTNPSKASVREGLGNLVGGKKKTATGDQSPTTTQEEGSCSEEEA